MEHNEYLKNKKEFEEKLLDPKNNYLMSYYKSSYDGSIKEAIPYLRKAYYDQRKKSLQQRKSKLGTSMLLSSMTMSVEWPPPFHSK